MVKAQATGRVNYKELDFRDPNSYVIERFGLKVLEDELYEGLLKLNFQKSIISSIFSPPWLADTKYHSKLLDNSNNTYTSIGKLVAPWLNWDRPESEDNRVKEAAGLMERWKAAFGDPDSDEIKQKLADYKRSKRSTASIGITEPIPKSAKWVYN